MGQILAYPTPFERSRICADRAAKCIICGLWAEQVDGAWLTDTYVDDDGEGPFVTGSDLVEAAETDYGFVCSDPCRSQAMYEYAENWQKEVLTTVLDALRVIQEYGGIARNIVNGQMPAFYFGEDFIAEAGKNITSMTGDGEPEWSNR
jgi:hypothetical protein